MTQDMNGQAALVLVLSLMRKLKEAGALDRHAVMAVFDDALSAAKLNPGDGDVQDLLQDLRTSALRTRQ